MDEFPLKFEQVMKLEDESDLVAPERDEWLVV